MQPPDHPTPPASDAPSPTALAAQEVDDAHDGRGVPTQVHRLRPFLAHLAHSVVRGGRALIEAGNLAEVVPTLAPVELYLMIKEMGVDEAAPLLLEASAEQVQALCDLDCWDGENFSAEELDAWLAPFLAEGPQVLAEAFLRLDEEVQVLFLQGSLRVLDMREQDGSVRKVDEVPWPEDVAEDAPYKTTPEGFFTLIDTSQSLGQEREVPPLVLVDALRDLDANECFRLLTAARWELSSPLMEQGLQFREGRMGDLGFVPTHEAQRLFAPPPPKASESPLVSPATIGGAAPLPALYAQALQEAADCTFVAAMAYVQDAAQLARLEGELVLLINAAVVAYGQRSKNYAQVHQVARYVRDFLSLGLLAQAPAGDVAACAARLLAQPLQEVFQRGIAAVRPLQRAAAAAAARAKVAAWLQAADVGAHDPQAADRAFVRALAHVRPLWAGRQGARPDETSAWQTPAQLDACRARLEALVAAIEAPA